MQQPHRPAAEYFGEITDERRHRVIQDIAALSLLSEDDPPIYMQYGMAPDDPPPDDVDRVQGWRVHHVNFGVALAERSRELGVTAHLKYPGADVAFPTDVAFFREHLLGRGE